MARPTLPLIARAQWTRLRQMSTSRQITVAALILIVAQVAFRSYFVSRSWFYVDDFYFLSDIASGRDDLAWYFRLHQGHFMPLSFVLVKLASGFGAYPWAAVATQILILQLLASASCWWMLRTLFGARPLTLALLAAYLLSPLTVDASVWWAVAVNQLPHQIAVFGAISAHVVFARTGRRRWAFIAAAFLILGFSTYTKTLLLPVILGLLSLLYFASGGIGHRILAVMRTQWLALGLYATITAAFLASYVSRLPTNVERGNDLYNLASTTVLSSLGTTVLGGPWAATLYGDGPIVEASPPVVGVVAAWTAIAVAIFWIWARRERALRALVLPITYVAISVLIIYSGRGLALQFIGGIRVGNSLRYLGDSTPILILALALMLLPLVGAVESSAPRERPLASGPPSRWVVVALALVVAAGSVASTIRLTQSWTSDYVERTFTQNAEITVRYDDPLFADASVPSQVMPVLASPYDLIQEYLAPLGGDLHTAAVGNDLSVFNLAGSAIPAVVEGAPRTAADPDESCPYRIREKPRTIEFAPVINFGLWIGVDYRATLDGDALLEYGSQRVSVPILSGSHTLFVRSSDAFDSITLTPATDQNLCVSAVRVGFITDRPTP